MRLLLLMCIPACIPIVTALPKPHHLVWVPPTTSSSSQSSPVERSIAEEDQDEIENRVEKFDVSDFPAPGNLPIGDSGKETKAQLWDPEEIERNSVHACDETNAPGRHMIYCSGRLLEAVMATRLHPDSKTFVDRSMKENRTGPMIIDEFNKRFTKPVAELTQTEVKAFVDEHFDTEDGDLIRCNLTDWYHKPDGIEKIRDRTLRNFAFGLHTIWKDLCREVAPTVKAEPERFSLIPVPNPFIIPGGRFREFYYWDAYWVIRGLLVSGMTTTVQGMIRNFAHMINTYGFVPNGGRIYYLQRSEPPLFAPMVYEYFQKTKDIDFVIEMLPSIERETEFWKKNRTVTVQRGNATHTVIQYRTPLTNPRPESYREDMTAAQSIHSVDDKHKFFQNLASAAESGWDFSTRWFRDKKTIGTIETTNVVPVDLNAYLCYNLHILAHFYSKLGNVHKQAKWLSEYISFRQTFKDVFYVQQARGWYDYNLRTREHNLDFYPSMAVPLFTQCYDPLNTGLADDLYNQMESMGVFNFKGGVPTSLKMVSTEQWDFPNGWSPLNHMIIEGLRKSGNPRMQQKAFKLAEKWVLSNLQVFKRDDIMWEKYNVVASKPRTGNGGEYAVQAGFGWTNGVVMDLLSTYGERLSYPTIHPPMIPLLPMFKDHPSQASSINSNSISVFAIILLVICTR